MIATHIENNNDYKLLRVLCLIGAVTSPIAKIAWFRSISDPTKVFTDTGLTLCIISSTFFMLLFALTFFCSYIKKNAYFFTYALYFFAGAIFIYLMSYNNFSLQSILLMLLFTTSINMVVKKKYHLIVYNTCIFLLILIALFTLKQRYPNQIFIAFFFVLYFVFNYGFVRIRFKSENELQKSEEDYRNLVEISPQAIIVSQNDKIVYSNSAAVILAAAHNSNDLKDQPIINFLNINDAKIVFAPKIDATISQSPEYFEESFNRMDGTQVEVEAAVITVKHNGKPAIMNIVKDISERKAAQNEMSKIAYHDTLTGLPNRYLLNINLKNIISSSEKSTQSIAVLFIDLDRFKLVNDTLGHNDGDTLLQQVSERLVRCVRKDDIVSRYGGDEFVVVLNNYKGSNESIITQRIMDAFRIPFNVSNHEIYISPSIGISMYPDDGTNVNTLIKNADVAMYLAKQKGKNNIQYFSPDLNDRVSRKMDLENGLRKALLNDELELYYQPQINIQSHQIIGIEALLRWNNPDLGMVFPVEFIPLAEETGLIVSIGEWVLKTACIQNKAWQKAGFTHIPISVNVSRCQLMYSDFKETIRNALVFSELEPKYLDIEITESIMQEINSMAMSLNDIKSLGVKISIDDFGTGYSSLNILKNLHIDNLKIDMSFINDLTTNAKTVGIIKSIIDMGHALNLTVIAEGVEQEPQCIVLKDNVCDCVQGYYFSRPLPAAKMEKFWHTF